MMSETKNIFHISLPLIGSSSIGCWQLKSILNVITSTHSGTRYLNSVQEEQTSSAIHAQRHTICRTTFMFLYGSVRRGCRMSKMHLAWKLESTRTANPFYTIDVIYLFKQFLINYAEEKNLTKNAALRVLGATSFDERKM